LGGKVSLSLWLIGSRGLAPLTSLCRMKRYRLAICRGSDCRSGGANAIHRAADEAVSKEGLAGRCEVARGGCYGLCHLGPNVVLREEDGRPRDPFSRDDFRLTGVPGEVHYGAMTPEKVARVIAALRDDRPLPATPETSREVSEGSPAPEPLSLQLTPAGG
jgi:(2Fe-2S) ferredoxin